MKAILTTAASAILLAACASTGPSSLSMRSSASNDYWRSNAAGTSQFPGDNAACSARASRLGSVATAPENRIDRPIQKWPNATAQEVYDACMLERGWRPAG